MKQSLLFLCLLSLTGATAQSYYPSAYDLPEGGFDAFKIENPYITVFNRNPNNTSEWVPLQRFMTYPAPNVPYTGVDRTSMFDANEWTEVQSTLDSFVLNGTGQIATNYSHTLFNYPGFNDEYKSKFNMTYNASGQLVNYKGYDATPPTSENYVLSSNIFISYDDQGKRIKDSMLYGNNPPYLTSYSYDGAGNVILDATIQNEDTVYKTILHYNSSNQIENITSLSFDAASAEWFLNNIDTFTYSNNLLTQHISYGLLFQNGNVGFEPSMNERYTYTGTGKLESIEYSNMQDEIWMPYIKTIFTYGSNDKPTVGYTYTHDGSGWNTEPGNKYLFDNFVTSTPTISKGADFNLYPNPANNLLFLETQNQPASFVFTDIKGRIVFQGKTAGDTQIHTDMIPNGLYFVSVSTQQGSSTQRITINH